MKLIIQFQAEILKEAIGAGAGIILTGRGKGARVSKGARVNPKTHKVSRQGQFTEIQSWPLDPEGPKLSAGSLQKIDEFTTSVAPNATILRPGDPTGGPVVSGALGKAAIITTAAAVGAKAISESGQKNPNGKENSEGQIVPAIDNTSTTIIIMTSGSDK